MVGGVHVVVASLRAVEVALPVVPAAREAVSVHRAAREMVLQLHEATPPGFTGRVIGCVGVVVVTRRFSGFAGAATFGATGVLSSSTRNLSVGGTTRAVLGDSRIAGVSLGGAGALAARGVAIGCGSIASESSALASSASTSGGLSLVFTKRGGGNGLATGFEGSDF